MRPILTTKCEQGLKWGARRWRGANHPTLQLAQAGKVNHFDGRNTQTSYKQCPILGHCFLFVYFCVNREDNFLDNSSKATKVYLDTSIEE